MKRPFLFILILVLFKVPPLLAKPSPDCERLVSLAPSATEVLFAIGLGPNLVGVTNFDQYPEEVTGLPKVGGYTNPDYEAILRLKPGLVVLVDANEKAAEKLELLGVKTILTNHRDLAGVLRSFTLLGERCGRLAEGRAVQQGLRARIEKVRDKVKGRARVKALITLNRGLAKGGDKFFVAGQGTFFNDLIELAGGSNAYQGGQQGYPLIGSEAVMRLDPQVILDLIPHFRDRGHSEEEAKQGWQGLQGVSAVRADRVHPINENYFNLPGPRLVLALEDMAKLLHPELEW